MLSLIKSLRGDKVIWALVALLALFSFMPVFSASSNLAYAGKGTGNTVSYLVKHLVHVALGFYIIYRVHKIPYHYFRSISRIVLPFIWVLLAYTLFKGTVIAGANASRWIQVPFVGISFQTSALASRCLSRASRLSRQAASRAPSLRPITTAARSGISAGRSGGRARQP